MIHERWHRGTALYLDQEEGDTIGLEGTGQFHIANFSLDLTHVPTVLMGLQQQGQNITLAPITCCATMVLSQPFQALAAPLAPPTLVTASF